MNDEPQMSLCRGEFQDHWMTGSRPCSRRDGCARYVYLNVGIPGAHLMAHCVDHGSLSAFVPLRSNQVESD